jgi:hypothetical protein
MERLTGFPFDLLPAVVSARRRSSLDADFGPSRVEEVEMSFRRQYLKDLVGDTSGHEGGIGLVILVVAKRPVFRQTLVVGAALVIAATVFWDCIALLAFLGVFLAAFLFALADSATGTLLRLERGTRPLSLPQPECFHDRAVRDMLCRLTAARCQLGEAASADRKGKSHVFASASREIRAIEGGVIVTTARAEHLSRLLSTVPPADLENDLERLKCLERRALTPATRHAYGAAIAAREGLVAVVEDIGCQREWLLASADRLLCALESLPARVVRIQFMRGGLEDGVLSGLDANVDHLRVLIEAMEETFAVADKLVSPFTAGTAAQRRQWMTSAQHGDTAVT